jgi:hypothetical protein
MNRKTIITASGWLSLLTGLLLSGLLVSGVVANAAGNDGLGSGLHLLAIVAAVVWIAISLLAIAMAPKSTVARRSCRLPLFVWAGVWLLLLYVFNQV